jgi:D-serine deaminase-like pyridoxal phosphate-dependent protein
MLSWDDARAVLADERLPALLVDRDALDRNTDLVLGLASRAGKPVRLATKSIRSVRLLERVLTRGAPFVRGLLAYSVDEAVRLAERGHGDILVAYPTVERRALENVAQRAPDALTLLVDHRDHVDAIAKAARVHRARLKVCLELDVSFRARAGQVHLGPRRSPLRDAESVVALAREIADRPELELAALMGYEAHIAGLSDASFPMRTFKKLAWPRVLEVRQATFDALKREGLLPKIVNGGGSGSLPLTLADPSTTEATIGSGLLCSHLFDRFDVVKYEPAIFFALEVCRVPDRDHVTCRGGGYIASGEPGPDRSPRPVLPEGLSYVEREGAGEVQTPLVLASGARAPRIGDPVLFRPAKAGEIAERFAEHVMYSGTAIVDRAPTYRGEGWTFF